MTNSINKVFLMGKANGPVREIITVEGYIIYTLSLTTYYGYENKGNGKSKRAYEIHRICAYAELGAIMSSRIQEGDLIAIEGYLRTRKYTNKEDKRSYITEVIAKEVMYLDEIMEEDLIYESEEIAGIYG